MLRSLTSFLEPEARARIPERLLSIWSTVEVFVPEDRPAKCRVRVSALKDWWFCYIEGEGEARVREEGRLGPVDDYLFLALMLGGVNRTGKGVSPPLDRAGQIALYEWRGPYAVSSAGEFRYLIAHIPRVHLKRSAGEAPIPYDRALSAHTGAGAVLAAALRALASEAGRATPAADLAVILDDMAGMVVRTFSAVRADSARPAQYARLDRVHDYISAHFADTDLSARQIASACGLSERQLFREFAAAQTTLARTIRRQRLEQAAARLLDPGFHGSIAEIAFACGFASAAHFAREFRKAYQATPSVYRAANLRRM